MFFSCECLDLQLTVIINSRPTFNWLYYCFYPPYTQCTPFAYIWGRLTTDPTSICCFLPIWWSWIAILMDSRPSSGNLKHSLHFQPQIEYYHPLLFFHRRPLHKLALLRISTWPFAGKALRTEPELTWDGQLNGTWCLVSCLYPIHLPLSQGSVSASLPKGTLLLLSWYCWPLQAKAQAFIVPACSRRCKLSF